MHRLGQDVQDIGGLVNPAPLLARARPDFVQGLPRASAPSPIASSGGMAEQLLIWFAILVAINLQTSFLTPPFGYALFYLKGIAPEGVAMSDIYGSITPFVLLQLLGLLLAVIFPGLVLWLPTVIAGSG
jgi:hypothetical protein